MRRFWIVSLVVVLGACASGPGESEVVASVADDAVLPALKQAATDAAVLADSLEHFCASPSEASKSDAEVAWLTAKTSWEMAELATFFGPGQMLSTVAKVDYEPAGIEGIDELVASDTVLDVAYVQDHAASTHRGLGTIEYLLFDNLERASGERVCALSTSSAAVIETETARLAEAWATSYEGEAAYRDTFVEKMASDDSLGEIVSAILETLQNQAGFELGRGLGITVQEADPSAIPEGRAEAGARRYLAQLEGIRGFLEAGGEDSLSSLISARSAELAGEIDSLLDEAIGDMEAIQGSLVEIARDDPERLSGARETIHELGEIFEADVLSELGITVGLSDADGDSG